MIYFAAFENKGLSERATIDLFVVAGVFIRQKIAPFRQATSNFNQPLGHVAVLDRRLKD